MCSPRHLKKPCFFCWRTNIARWLDDLQNSAIDSQHFWQNTSIHWTHQRRLLLSCSTSQHLLTDTSSTTEQNTQQLLTNSNDLDLSWAVTWDFLGQICRAYKYQLLTESDPTSRSICHNWLTRYSTVSWITGVLKVKWQFRWKRGQECTDVM